MARRESGFTLIELLVALTIGSLVVLVAHQLFAAVAAQGKRLTQARASLDRTANAHRWLEAMFLSLDVGSEGASGFEGRADHATFSAWLLTPDGWFERQAVSLERRDERLVANITPGTSIALIDSVQELAVDYLLEPGAESRWVREWVSPVSAPLAVRIRLKRPGTSQGGDTVLDTLLFLIKERG